MAKSVSTTSLTMYNQGSNVWRSTQVVASGLYSLQSTAPSYVGAFIPDNSAFNGIQGDFTGQQKIAMSGSNGDKMFLTGRNLGTGGQPYVGEFNIPSLSAALDVNQLNIASNQAGYVDLRSSPSSIPTTVIGGLLEISGQLVAGSYVYYDATNAENKNVIVLSNAGNIDSATIKGAFAFPNGARLAGYTIPIPAQFQSQFGGNTHWVGGGVGMSIVSRASQGPNLWAFNESDLLGATTGGQNISATACSDYPYGLNTMLSSGGNGSTIDDLLSLNVIWNFISFVGGGFVVPGTRTVMFVGNNWDGRGTIGYKITNNEGFEYAGFGPSLADAYANYYWLFDIDDLADGYSGAVSPSDIRPYEHGIFPFSPFSTTSRLITGVCYDSVNNRMYASVNFGANERFPFSPLISAFDLGVS